MYVLSKTNYQDFENNVECFKMLKEAFVAVKSFLINHYKDRDK